MRTTLAMLATVATLLGGAAFGEEQGGAAEGAAVVQGCANDRDCDDADPKTQDLCQRILNGQEQAEARCVHAANECAGNGDCDDQNPATRDTCLRSVGEYGEPEARCRHEAAPEGCRVNPDCDDGNPETRDYCHLTVDGEVSEARCVNDPIDTN